jgi:hypothetical protein
MATFIAPFLAFTILMAVAYFRESNIAESILNVHKFLPQVLINPVIKNIKYLFINNFTAWYTNISIFFLLVKFTIYST